MLRNLKMHLFFPNLFFFIREVEGKIVRNYLLGTQFLVQFHGVLEIWA